MPRPKRRLHRTTTSGTRGGNLEIDTSVKALGKSRKERRIRKSVGSSDPQVYREAQVLLHRLAKEGRFDLLRKIRDDEVSIPQLLSEGVPSPAEQPDAAKLTAFLWDRETRDAAGVVRAEPGAFSRAFHGVKDGPNKDRYIASLKALQGKAALELPPTARVRDLLEVDYAALYAGWGATNADWMRLRQAISKFATLWWGDKFDPSARLLRQLVPHKTVKKRKPKISVDRFLEIVSRVPQHAADALWVLVITGVRRGEYLQSRKEHLDKATHTYDVPGFKNENSEATVRVDPRWWVFLERGIPPRLKEQQLRRYFKRACLELGIAKRVSTGRFKTVPEKLGPGVPVRSTPRRPRQVEILRYVGPTLHDLRHCHGQWAVDEGIPESKVQASFRHATPGMTRDYVMQVSTGEVSGALADLILPKVRPRGTGAKKARVTRTGVKTG